jgi:hypothetical protein
MKPKTFNPTSDHPTRALQAWQILIAAATNRQTYTYLGLSRMMYRKDAAGVLDQVLGHIAFFCQERRLPPLTAIVVGKHRGTPGHDIPVDRKTMDKQREKVYAKDWYDIYPPTTKQLADAFAKFS